MSSGSLQLPKNRSKKTFGSKKIVARKYCGSKTNLGKIKFLVANLILCQKIVGQKNLDPKKLRSKNFWVNKKFWVQKDFESKNLGLKKCLGQEKEFGLKKMLSLKNKCQKIFGPQ